METMVGAMFAKDNVNKLSNRFLPIVCKGFPALRQENESSNKLYDEMINLYQVYKHLLRLFKRKHFR